MLKNAASNSRLKWPFTCVTSKDTEVLSFDVADLERTAASIDKAATEDIDKAMQAVASAPPIAAAIAASPKLSADMRACVQRASVFWLPRWHRPSKRIQNMIFPVDFI